MRVFRVSPRIAEATPEEPGGALYRPRGGYGRIDNPNRYRTLYTSSHAEGAVAEAFGRLPEWNDATFVRGGVRCVLQYFDLDEKGSSVGYYALNDAAHLVAQELRPSQVVTRDRRTTRAWALRIFEAKDGDGVAWWSYYKPEWYTIALWNLAHLQIAGEPEPLTTAHPAVRAAAKEIARIIR